ncbi:MAG TPA: DUF5313 family protein [Actinophytocola sp.]|uniref:DUF5313 family protein n=1 Tax=Actinophytocola sp. TaxID=1872138 RepID=UPI002DBF7DEE|nr:DUF5313 family protein [Actinophytocola sp.]HEU5472806.1 DUF5313 family protein [Actinophytocola sp.]
MGRSRPGPIRWLWYAVGGRLPDEYREWVLYDLTAPTWVLRHLCRAMVQHSVWLLLLLLPIPLTLRIWMVVTGVSVGLFFSLAFIEDASERRLIRQGFPVGLNRKIREESSGAQRSELAAMYAAYYTTEPDV